MKKLIIGSLLVFLTVPAYSQNSIETMFNYSKELVNELEKLKYEVVYVDFNILTQSDKTEENIRMFSTGNDYIVVAYGDPERVDEIKIHLYESVDSKWEVAQEGKPLATDKTMYYTSTLTYNTTVNKNNLIQVEATSFKEGSTSGRFFVIIGHKPSAPTSVELSASKCQEVKLTKKNEIVNVGGSYSCESYFSVTAETIQHELNRRTSVYKIKTTKTIDNGMIYTVEDESYVSYVILINTKDGTLDIFKASDDKTLPGTRYFIAGGG